MSPPHRPCVAAVLVTFNRRALLLEAITAVLGQTRPPDRVYVIDNASSDGTQAAVRARHPDVRFIRLRRNTGGAGGFAYGIARALSDGAEAIWLMDDDTIPQTDALEALLLARAQYAGPTPTVVASRVCWIDGRDHPMNTPRQWPLVSAAQRASATAVGCVAIRTASFVSILVDANACRRRGLPHADYFLWNDDFEFTARLLRGKVGLGCPASVVEHRTNKFGAADADPGERFFYEVRNKVWTLGHSDALNPLERVLYGGATILRWGRTFSRSSNRRTLASQLGRGLVAGIRSGPRQTSVLLHAVS